MQRSVLVKCTREQKAHERRVKAQPANVAASLVMAWPEENSRWKENI